MSTYATTATVPALYNGRVDVNHNLRHPDTADVLRLDAEGSDGEASIYLDREQAVALAWAILDVAAPLAAQVYRAATAAGPPPGTVCDVTLAQDPNDHTKHDHIPAPPDSEWRA